MIPSISTCCVLSRLILVAKLERVVVKSPAVCCVFFGCERHRQQSSLDYVVTADYAYSIYQNQCLTGGGYQGPYKSSSGVDKVSV